MNLFEGEPEVEPKGEAVSFALIANGRHTGCVLEYRGAGIENEIDEVGLYALDDLGLDDAPEGLSIWEGKAHYWKSGNPFDGEEWNGELLGKFRPLTSEEWATLARGEKLWPHYGDPDAPTEPPPGRLAPTLPIPAPSTEPPLILTVASRFPDAIDLDGRIAEDGRVEYIGKATRQADGKYVCLARVGSCLCVVQVGLTPLEDVTAGGG